MQISLFNTEIQTEKRPKNSKPKSPTKKKSEKVKPVQTSIFDRFIDDVEDIQDEIPFEPNMAFPEKQTLLDTIDNKIKQVKKCDVMKHLEKVIDLIHNKTHHDWGRCFDILLDFFGVGFGYLNPHDDRSLINIEILQTIAQEIPGADIFYDLESDTFEDYLGTLYMTLNARSKSSRLGQFFTPVCVAQTMAKMVFDPNQDDLITETVNDPCGGSGGMLISAWYEIRKAVKRLDKPYSGLFMYQDIDYQIYKLGMINLRIHSVGWDFKNMFNRLLCYNMDTLKYITPPENCKPNSWFPWSDRN